MCDLHYSCDKFTRATLVVSLRLSVISWATLEQHVPPLGQGLVEGQVPSGWTMSTVPGGRLLLPHATSMVGEFITVLIGRTQGLSVQVSTPCLT